MRSAACVLDDRPRHWLGAPTAAASASTAAVGRRASAVYMLRLLVLRAAAHTGPVPAPEEVSPAAASLGASSGQAAKCRREASRREGS